jgi:hypothetical protein
MNKRMTARLEEVKAQVSMFERATAGAVQGDFLNE